MISLIVEKDIKATEKLFLENKIEFNENSNCLKAQDKDLVLGYSLFDLDKEKIVIKYITPQNDLSLVDGILRSTLHVAAERFVMNAFYESDEMFEIFNCLNFVKNKEEKSLNVDKLFTSCQSCK